MTSEPELPPVVGAIADDREGTPLGTVTAVFVDDVTGRPTWVGLSDGTHAAPDATDVAIVAPIADARLTDGRLRLAVSADAVHSAPRPGAPDRLSPAEEVTLQEHYAGGTGRAGTGQVGTGRTDTELIRTDTSGTGYPGTGHPGTERAVPGAGDGTLTRSEERLSVATVTEPWSRAVLRIEEVTEEVMVPVTITRQQARIEYLPLRAGDRTAGAPGTDTRAGRTGAWVTLYSEQPVVTLERTPAERVRLTTSWVSEEMPVTEQLRHEEIELTTDAPQR